ncbi:MAG: lipopolysaccharide heptosyltransferase II [Candidatus Binatia bacterium]
MRRPASTEAGAGPAVVVPQTSFLGDVVLTTPLFAALRARVRPRRLAVIVRPEAVPLVEGHPDVDEVLVDDKRGRDRGVRGALRVARRVRERGFDLAVSPHRSLRTAVVLAMARVPRRIGFDESRGAALFHERIARDRRLHDVERNLALMAPFGGADGAPRLFVPVQPAAERRARELVPEGAGPLVAIAPASVWATKRWRPEGFAAVASRLAGAGARIVLLGAPGDRGLCEEIAARTGGAATPLAGRTDLATMVAVIDRAAVLVGNDSAPMHVACARGVPVVAVFCATTPALGYGPYGPHTRVVEVDLACRPCGRHGGQRCPRGTEDCMRLVDPEAVVQAVRSVWRTEGGR